MLDDGAYLAADSLKGFNRAKPLQASTIGSFYDKNGNLAAPPGAQCTKARSPDRGTSSMDSLGMYLKRGWGRTYFTHVVDGIKYPMTYGAHLRLTTEPIRYQVVMHSGRIDLEKATQFVGVTGFVAGEAQNQRFYDPIEGFDYSIDLCKAVQEAYQRR